MTAGFGVADGRPSVIAIQVDDHGPTHVRTWYPPFCVVVDVIIGLPLLFGWIL
jgi:hypothetical protein